MATVRGRRHGAARGTVAAMPLGRRIALLPLAALLMAGAAAPADAAKKRRKPATEQRAPDVQPKGHRFTVTFWEKRTTKWNQPAYNYRTDCYHRYFDEGRGSETVELKLRQPAKVLVFPGTDPLLPLNFVWGTWDLKTVGRPARVAGVHTRARRMRAWSEPGKCGSSPEPDTPPPPKQDCGTRLPPLEMIMSVGADKKLYARLGGDQTVTADDRAGAAFKNCNVLRPKAARDEWNPKAPKIAVPAFLNQRRSTINFKYDETFEETAPAGTRPYKTSTRVQWKIVFTRVRR